MKYDVMIIVIMATKIVRVKILLEIWPSNNPWATIIKENSEIWAKWIEVRKLILLLYPKKEHMNMMMNGFRIITSANRMINGMIIFLIWSSINSIPNDTKNIVAKKSLKERTFPIIAKLYGRLARLNPARKAPIAIDKFR